MSGDTKKKLPIQAGPQAGEKIDFDDYSANYDELLHESTKLYAEDSEYFAKYKVDLVRQSIRSPVKRVLEYGCGTGRNIGYLQAAFPEAKIFGTDVSSESLRMARANNSNAEFELEAPGLDMGRFDLIFIASVFHHILPIDRKVVMKSLAARLAPQGTIDVFEHNPFNPVTRKIVNDCPFDADAVLLKPEELRGLFRHAAIRLDRVSYCLFVPPRLSWLIPLEKYLRWFPLGGQYWVRGTGS
ncbi:class I SAM-dependent methyltransferase [Variovorax arabinosiphilus]|uniref:class I SAM-dependent methyltransferase n=1 Tax=Variovorax arabinosiphilus TaxID=3053498 RepID=UPI002576394F|nr:MULTISPECIES: class I SAM-dependent methyltransferase [unclassified Variovorax]MDM0122283.1 class I SAM-dependent methyltransferase [Variovorax sp. J2L1-78]MDM0131188.1 class I SAM-dependent methyltransferase [Variovorax sp. J2L1-63]MDM0235046.1 class I SAM-dependent methyltransferase [Variovorax sp. J2R1-6]